jgi:hypothetical protein
VRARVRKVFGKQDWHFLEQQADALRGRFSLPALFREKAEFMRFAETRANALVLTTPRFVRIQGDPLRVADTLFERLVGETRRIQRVGRVTRKLTRVLTEKGILPFVQQNVEIAIPKLGKTLKASYGYQNGRFNLIQPEQFELSDRDRIFQKASRLAVEGKFIHDEADPKFGQMQLVVVGQFKPDQADAREMVVEIFRKSDVNIYSFDRMDPLLDDIKQNALKHGLTGPFGQEKEFRS